MKRFIMLFVVLGVFASGVLGVGSHYIVDESEINVVEYYKEYFDEMGVAEFNLDPNSCNKWEVVVKHIFDNLSLEHRNSGVVVYFPGGFYNIQNEILIPAFSHGEGYCKSVKFKGITNGRPYYKQDDYIGGPHDLDSYTGTTINKIKGGDENAIISLYEGDEAFIEISGFNFGSEVKCTYGILFNKKSSSYSYIQNCHFSDIDNPIYFPYDDVTQLGYHDNINIHNVDISRHSGFGIYIGRGDYPHISSIKINYPNEGGEGICLNHVMGGFLNSILINNISSEYFPGIGYKKAFKLESVKGVSINGVHCESGGNIYSLSNCNNININGSTVADEYKTLLLIAKSNNITLSHHKTYTELSDTNEWWNPEIQADLVFTGAETYKTNTHSISLKHCTFEANEEKKEVRFNREVCIKQDVNDLMLSYAAISQSNQTLKGMDFIKLDDKGYPLFRVTNEGKVGIGTDPGTYKRLSVQGSDEHERINIRTTFNSDGNAGHDGTAGIRLATENDQAWTLRVKGANNPDFEIFDANQKNLTIKTNGGVEVNRGDLKVESGSVEAKEVRIQNSNESPWVVNPNAPKGTLMFQNGILWLKVADVHEGEENWEMLNN